MALGVVRSRSMDALHPHDVTVAVDLASGLPSFTKVVCQLAFACEPSTEGVLPS
jgi:hypothetical protein